jgi:hypothetical protein
MSTENIALVQSREAGESMTTKQFYIVQLDATGKIEVGEGATDLLVGVLQNYPAAGEQAVYAYGGVAKVKAGGTVGVGAWVTSDGNGKAVATTTDGDIVIGRHIGTAAAADGDLIEVQLGIQHLYIA